jgi:hypothetical protein
MIGASVITPDDRCGLDAHRAPAGYRFRPSESATESATGSAPANGLGPPLLAMPLVTPFQCTRPKVRGKPVCYYQMLCNGTKTGKLVALDHDMKEGPRLDRPKRVPVSLWWGQRSLILAVILFACGRQSGLHQTTGDGSQGGSGGYAGGSGGGIGGAISGGGGGLYIDLGVGGSIRGNGGSGGGPEDSGVVDAEIMLLPDGACGNERPLWDAIAAARAVIGYCYRIKEGDLAEGYVVLDNEGRVTYNSVFCKSDCSDVGDADREKWLASLARYRWPCLSGQTIRYYCVSW